MKTIGRLLLAFLLPAFGSSQEPVYSPEQENALHKIIPGKQLYREDEPCGSYFWKSQKAARGGAMVLYFFYGSTEYGKGKLGLYEQVKFRVVVNDDKDPPTAQVVKEKDGTLKEVKVQMTTAEYKASSACFPPK